MDSGIHGSLDDMNQIGGKRGIVKVAMCVSTFGRSCAIPSIRSVGNHKLFDGRAGVDGPVWSQKTQACFIAGRKNHPL